MRLKALDEHYAIYLAEGEESPFDAFEALDRLLTVNSYSSLVSFLRTTASNKVFAEPPAFPRSYHWRRNDIEGLIEKEKRWTDPFPEIFTGSLNKAIGKAENIDIEFLDDYTREDCFPWEYEIDVTWLIVFQQSMRALLRFAAVASGSKAPEGLFVELTDTNLKTLYKDLGFEVDRFFAVRLKDILLKENSYFGVKEGINDRRIFDSGEGYVFDFINDDYDNTEFHYDEEGFYCGYIVLATVKGNEKSAEEIIRYLAGKIVISALNAHWIYPFELLDQRETSINDFDLEKGFYQIKEKPPLNWAKDLYQEACECVFSGRVSLCPVCDSPVLIRDMRGGGREYCSDTCKTKANDHRRNKAYTLEASGVPLDEAILIIGEKHRKAVTRWYKEAAALH